MISSPKFLFEEDLAKKVRDVKETHHLGNTVGSSKDHSRRYRYDSWYGPINEKAAIRAVPTHDCLFGEGHATEQSQKNPLSEEQQSCGKERMRSLEQIKFSVSDFPSFIESSLRGYLKGRCDNGNG